MALAIDASSPAVVTQTNGATATLTTASFTPPTGSLVLVQWCGNSTSLPAAPGITDSLATDLTYTSRGWQSRADSPTKDGQAAQWTAPVVSSAAMTITVTNQASSGFREAAMRVTVLTGQDASPIGTNGKGGSASSGALAQSVTGTADGSQAFGAATDWDALGSMTDGTGCDLNPAGATGTPGGAVSYGFVKRSTADGTNGGSTTLNLTYAGTSTNISFVYIEIKPAAGGSDTGDAENAAGAGAADNAQASLSAPAEATAGTGAAETPVGLTSGQAGAVTGTGAAHDAASTAVVANGVEHAAGTGAAADSLATLSAFAEATSGTGAAADAAVTASGSGTAELASSTGAAGDPLASVAAADGGSSGTGAAADGAGYVSAFAECATGAGAADNITANTDASTQAPAECATGTGTANDVTVVVAASPELASGSGTAPDALADVGVRADVANASGAAFDGTVSALGQAEASSGTGAAQDVLAALAAAVEAALSSVVAEVAIAGVGGHAGEGAAAGAAHDPSVLGSSTTSGPAECAIGTGTANAPDYPGERPGAYGTGARQATYATGGRAATYAVSSRQATYSGTEGRP